MKRIYEMPVYHGGLKQFHILNLNTSTFYGTGYNTLEECEANIEAGTKRCGKMVTKVSLQEANEALDSYMHLTRWISN